MTLINYLSKLGNKTMYVTVNENCIRLLNNTVSNVGHLSSTQEEADGRLLLHAADISKEYSSVIINADDTDVFLLMIAHAQYINIPLYQRSSTIEEKLIL